MNVEKIVYNLPIAAFTFGKNGQTLPQHSIYDLSDKKDESIKNNYNSIESKESKDYFKNLNDDPNKRFSFKNIINKKNINKDLDNNNINNLNNNNFIFIDKEESNSSYIKIILYSLSFMTLINNYIINEVEFNNKFNIKHQNLRELLLIIRDILMKIDQIKNINNINNNSNHINNIINIEQLKENLSELYKNENKFLKNYPDDPMDFLYIIINYFHEINTNKSSNKICNECFSHKNISMIIYKVYECECKARSKIILTNNNNYFLDIPINIIINKNSKKNLIDMNQMLFNYYQKLIYSIKIKGDCPKYGKNCKINKLHKKYILKNNPSYLIFNLENYFFKNNELFCSLNNILKIFVLIPHILNISTLFELENRTDKNYYELMGIIFLKISKIYSCAFKSKDIFYYYEDNIFLKFKNYYDIILFSLKNGNIPIAIFYQNTDLNLDKKNIDKDSINYNLNYDLTLEQINKLEKYVKNANNLNQNLKNKIRISEKIISDDIDININNNNLLNNTPKNPSLSDNYSSSLYTNSVNSYNVLPRKEYICNNCERINKGDNFVCFFCGFDNKGILTDNKNKQNNNIRKLKNNIIIKRKIILKRKKNSKSNIKDELGEIEDSYQNISPKLLKYFDMKRPFTSSKKNLKINFSQKQKLSSKIINKNKIPFNINNNISNNNINYRTEKKLLNLKINNSPRLTTNNFYINKTSHNSQKNLNKPKNNYFISYTNRNSDNNKLNLNNYNNSEFYTENNQDYNKYNNQLNINLKINNNNNYNIFEFNGRNKLIQLNNYSTEENYYPENNNKIKTKKIINYNLSNKTWICFNCLNKNESSMMKCPYCNKKRSINSINKSPKNKSEIINQNRINFNNMLIGQMSTKNKNIINKI